MSKVKQVTEALRGNRFKIPATILNAGFSKLAKALEVTPEDLYEFIKDSVSDTQWFSSIEKDMSENGADVYEDADFWETLLTKCISPTEYNTAVGKVQTLVKNGADAGDVLIAGFDISTPEVEHFYYVSNNAPRNSPYEEEYEHSVFIPRLKFKFEVFTSA